MNDLPSEISLLFITNEKMTSNKADILDFCDSIQDLVLSMHDELEVTNDLQSGQKLNDLESNQLNRMEIVEFDLPGPSTSVRGRGRGRPPKTGVIAKRGRGSKSKIVTNISSLESIEESSSDYDFMQVDNTSRSSWSEDC